MRGASITYMIRYYAADRVILDCQAPASSSIATCRAASLIMTANRPPVVAPGASGANRVKTIRTLPVS